MSDNNNKGNKRDNIISEAILSLMSATNLATNKSLPKSLDDSIVEFKSEVEDAYSNALLGIGGADKVEKYTSYGFSNNTLNFTYWLALYNHSWVFRRVIDKPSEDMVRQGLNIISEHNKNEEIIRRFNKLKSQFTLLYKWGRLFGGAVMVLLFDGVELNQMHQSIDVFFKNKTLTKETAMSAWVTDRWYGLQWSDETVTEISDGDFGKPKYYTITFADGKQYKIHYSWVLRYEHRVAPNLIKLGMLQGWGYSEGSHIINELNRDEKLKNSIQSLINKSLIEVIKMSGMRGVFMGADQDNQAQLKKRLEMVNWGRNFNSLTFLDTNDDYQMNTFPGLSGLSDILEQNMWLVAAAVNMQGILFGDLKGGFSNDVEALTRYNETISTLNDTYARPALFKFIKICYMLEDIEEDVEFGFNSLVVRKDDEKLNDMNSLANMLSSGISDGYITPELAAIAVKNYSEKIGLELPIDDEYIQKVKELSEQESEELDKLFAESDENTYTHDVFVEDLRHLYSLERKYAKKYPKMRIVWYDVRGQKVTSSGITKTPSLYIFHDDHPITRGGDAAKYSIRFSDHHHRHKTYVDILLPRYDALLYERECAKFIANNPDIMEKLYTK